MGRSTSCLRFKMSSIYIGNVPSVGRIRESFKGDVVVNDLSRCCAFKLVSNYSNDVERCLFSQITSAVVTSSFETGMSKGGNCSSLLLGLFTVLLLILKAEFAKMLSNLAL